MFHSGFGRSLSTLAVLCMGLLLSCAGEPPPLTVPSSGNGVNREPLPPAVMNALWRVQGDQIVDGTGERVQLRGIAFGNRVWDHTEIPSDHHSGIDFERVKKMGMNSVRFYLTYKTFEDDDAPFEYKQSGWDWLDQNVAWAKKHDVRLILNMHAPAGGYQSLGKGAALWDDPQIQQRFINLWHAIAERYRAEPAIVGYDILNEPAPTKSLDQWKDLAQRTVSDIRLVDQHHVIFVERANAVGGDWSEDKNRNFFRVDDENVVYEFHFYKPFHFTHQNAAWSEFAAREGWYPDEHVVEVDWFQLKAEAVAESDTLPPGDSDWTMLETKPFVVRDTKLAVGKPFLVCDKGKGTALFDSLSLTKVLATPEGSEAAPVDPQAQPAEVETVFEIDLDTRRGWYFWNPTNVGRADFVPEGNGDNTAIAISKTEGPANLGSDPLRFLLEGGYEYQLLGLARGKSLAEGSRCQLRLEFYSSKVPVHTRGKDYLRQELDAYLAWGEQQKVPLYLGEFGTIRSSFLTDRGGVTWVKDMLDLILERNLGFAYHAYHESAFGLFMGDAGLPSAYGANLPLHELFVKTLVGPDADPKALLFEPARRAPEPEPEKPQPKPAPKKVEEATPENFHEFD